MRRIQRSHFMFSIAILEQFIITAILWQVMEQSSSVNTKTAGFIKKINLRLKH